jgi:hypothetical protein
MRLGVSLAGFAAAAETTNVVDRAVELGSPAERLGLAPVRRNGGGRRRAGHTRQPGCRER